MSREIQLVPRDRSMGRAEFKAMDRTLCVSRRAAESIATQMLFQLVMHGIACMDPKMVESAVDRLTKHPGQR